MSSDTRRIRRMERRRTRGKQSALNLVSLMDIFTILVFFLLVSSSNLQQLPNSKDLRLPTSIAKKAPKETLIIAITPNNILVGGRNVALVNEVLSEQAISIAALKAELQLQADKGLFATVADKQNLSVTIMGDESTPYELMRKILYTCREANYTKIAFAAMQKAVKQG